jgi:peroxin-19
MENLMRELSAKSSAKSADKDESSPERARALKVAWEQMLVEGMDGDPGVGQSSGDSGFQDKIKQAVNKLKESESHLQADGKPPDAESLEALLGSLGGDDKEFTGLLENMMGELMSKPILYEPLAELEQKFPLYLENPPNPLSDEDRKRYDLQLNCIRRILAVFDNAGYDDADAESQGKIADLMAEMHHYGTPPAELMPVGPLGPLGPLPDDEGCTIT